nr:helix-turn-helix transcriptional regulator [Salinivibrio kushneri]
MCSFLRQFKQEKMTKRAIKGPDPAILFFIRQRIVYKMTQQDVAHQAGIPFRTYQRLETGQAELKMSQFRKLCRLYNVTSVDVALGELQFRRRYAADVASVAATLPFEVREHFLKLMIAIKKEMA